MRGRLVAISARSIAFFAGVDAEQNLAPHVTFFFCIQHFYFATSKLVLGRGEPR